MPSSTYQQLLSIYSGRFARFNRILGWLSFIRLALFIAIIGLGYRYLVAGQWPWLVAAITLLAVFIICIRLYDKIQSKADFTKALIKINQDEIAFLADAKASGYANGTEYIDPHHPYSYDLDVFGPGSLYQYLNRTTTSFGRRQLAEALLHPDTDAIQLRQEAIRELTEKIDFRQHIQALGTMHATNEKEEFDRLKDWIKAPPVFSQRWHYFILFLFPLATIGALSVYISSGSDDWLNMFFGLFIVNLFVTFSFAKKIMKQVSVSSKVTKTLFSFAGQLQQIEKQSFQSRLLQQLQGQLKVDGISASQAIHRLSSLFNYLDYIINLLVSALLNGFFLFHIHILFALDRWRKNHADSIISWLEIIGQFESLNSFANFSFNNRDFSYPEVMADEEFTAVQMGHPLIPASKRIRNDISFQKEKFVVLTGSNMSGKSTFLRTLGINLVLARAGAATCAGSYKVYPYDLHASMRITDSLQDSESFFYAELKRLQGIMREFREKRKPFVLLDEILRGTNSNDKHNGTVGLIRKLAAQHVCGIIATHDLTIANLSGEYNGYMGNKCFESVINGDELIFDYKLKEGVCTSLNASFLMKRMGIIE